MVAWVPRPMSKVTHSPILSVLANRPTLLVLAVVTLALGLAQVIIDLAQVNADPVLADGFRLALGALLASVGANHLITQSEVLAHEKTTSPAADSRPAGNDPA